jgi:hypothetical protein
MHDVNGRRRGARRTVTGFALAVCLPLCVPLCAGCAGGAPGKPVLEVAPKSALTGPKVIAVMGTRNEVVGALEEAMAVHGFTFVPYENRERLAAPGGALGAGRGVPAARAAGVSDNAKYALEITPDVSERCLGGGFILKSLTVSVIDRATNELMLRSSASGRTEKCAPVSGDTFHAIANSIDAAWQK